MLTNFTVLSRDFLTNNHTGRPLGKRRVACLLPDRPVDLVAFVVTQFMEIFHPAGPSPDHRLTLQPASLLQPVVALPARVAPA